MEKYSRAWQGTDDNIIQGMRFVCWIPKATNTHSEYVILAAFSRQILSTFASVLRYMYIGCLASDSIQHDPKTLFHTTLKIVTAVTMK